MATVERPMGGKSAPTEMPMPATQRQRLVQRGRSYQFWSRILTYAILVVASALILLPFIWLISSSLKTQAQYYAVPIQWIPNPVMWSNFAHIFSDYGFARYIVNSLVLAGVTVFIETMSSAFIAYGFARFHFKGRNLIFLIVLSTMMVPTQVTQIPLYTVFRNLGWINTFYPLIVPKLFGSALYIFILRQFFLTLPRELDEAARLDGCGSLRVFWHIILPQARPAVIVVAIFSFLASWRDTWGPLIYLSSDSTRTLPIGLLFFTTPYGQNFPLLMAATAVALSIPVLLYALGQRYIDSGVAIIDLK